MRCALGEKMRNAPIFLTVGQVQFNPIPQMGDLINPLLERFRKIGYADFSKDELKAIQVNASIPTPQVEIIPTMRWRFGNTKKTAEFLLFTDRLVFETTDYDNSELFIDALMVGIGIVHETIQLNYVSGVGVRTLDAVVPSDGSELGAYLHQNLLGFYGLSAGNTQHNVLEGVSKYEEMGQIVSRVVIIRGGLGLPFDLLPMMLGINPRFTQTNGIHAILDNDCTIQERFDWDSGQIRRNLKSAKAAVSEAFYQAVTESALNQWRN